MTCHVPSRLGIVLIVACLNVPVASAQQGPTRPFRGLFGGNERNLSVPQALDFTADVQGGHDDDILGAGSSFQTFDPRYQLGGDYAAMNLALAYSTALAGRAITISGRAASDFRYSPPALPEMASPRHEGAVSVGLIKTKGILSIRAQQGASYTPYRVLTLFPRLPAVDAAPLTGAGREFAISSNRVYGVNSEASLGVRLSRRSSLNLIYTRMLTEYSGQATHLVDQSAGASLSYRMTTHASLRLGYGYRLSSYSGSPGDAPVPSRNVDAGIDYNRPLSLSRKTSISFGSGSAATSDGNRTAYYATGAATLNHEIGRSWSARLSYSRALSFLDGFSTPFLTDGVIAETGGYLGRRVDLVLTAGYVDGQSGLSADRSRYVTSTGSGRLRVALSRYGSLYAQYFYYQYRFRDVGRALQGVPSSMERRGVRGGLTLWLPLLR